MYIWLQNTVRDGIGDTASIYGDGDGIPGFMWRQSRNIERSQFLTRRFRSLAKMPCLVSTLIILKNFQDNPLQFHFQIYLGSFFHRMLLHKQTPEFRSKN